MSKNTNAIVHKASSNPSQWIRDADQERFRSDQTETVGYAKTGSNEPANNRELLG